MQLLSINVGRPRLVQHQQQTLSTAIFKQPISGTADVHNLGIEGDDQADKSAHGGIDKAVYAYDEEDYAWYREQLAGQTLSPGAFGENLTTQGLPSGQVHIGDRYRVGTVLLEVTQPRTPCLKLGIKMRDPAFVKRFHQAGRPGFYLRVLEPGRCTAGDRIELTQRPERSMSVVTIYALRFGGDAEVNLLRVAQDLSGLSEAWRDDFRRLVDSSSG